MKRYEEILESIKQLEIELHQLRKDCDHNDSFVKSTVTESEGGPRYGNSPNIIYWHMHKCPDCGKQWETKYR